MTKKWSIVAAIAVVGFFIGSGIGIAFGGGSAINGAFLVAGIGGLIAFLLVPGEGRSVLPAGNEDKMAFETTDELARSGVSLLKQIAGWMGSVLRAIWNLEMRLLAALRLMHFFQKLPVLFALVAIGLLVIFLPVGILFVSTGIAALLRDPRAVNRFKVAWV